MIYVYKQSQSFSK
uniref:Uncharacterized protein n=1 Tax=Lepeophtheirus salmonis TaxID=72036 RepID=A0A0K2TMJ0_LEPSM